MTDTPYQDKLRDLVQWDMSEPDMDKRRAVDDIVKQLDEKTSREVLNGLMRERQLIRDDGIDLPKLEGVET